MYYRGTAAPPGCVPRPLPADLPPGAHSSGIAVASVTITGVPHACASTMGMPTLRRSSSTGHRRPVNVSDRGRVQALAVGVDVGVGVGIAREHCSRNAAAHPDGCHVVCRTSIGRMPPAELRERGTARRTPSGCHPRRCSRPSPRRSSGSPRGRAACHQGRTRWCQCRAARTAVRPHAAAPLNEAGHGDRDGAITNQPATTSGTSR